MYMRDRRKKIEEQAQHKLNIIQELKLKINRPQIQGKPMQDGQVN
jgi:hypothetical protein